MKALLLRLAAGGRSMGFNPMQGGKVRGADLAIFVVTLAVVAAAIVWTLL